MSFATFYYLPAAQHSSTAGAAARPEGTPTSKVFASSASTTTITSASGAGAGAGAPPRRPLRVTREALPELIDLLIRAVDFQLPSPRAYTAPVVPAAAQTTRAQSEGQPAATPSGGVFSRYLRSSFFGQRAASTSPAAVPASDSAASPPPPSSPGSPLTDHTADCTKPEPGVVRFYLHFPLVHVPTRPDDPTMTPTTTTMSALSIEAQEAEEDSDTAPESTRTPAQRVAVLVRRAQLQAASVVHRHEARQARAAQAVSDAAAIPSSPTLRAARSTSPGRSPSLGSQDTFTSATATTEASPVLSVSAPVAVPLLRLPTADTAVDPYRTKAPRGEPVCTVPTTSGAARTASAQNWTVVRRDPWQMALRRPGPDEVAMELRLRAYRVVRMVVATTTAAATSAPRRAASVSSALRAWLAPVINTEATRPVPLAEWVVPIIHVAHSGVTFLELDPYSNMFVPVVAAQPKPRSHGDSANGAEAQSTALADPPTRKLFCDNAEEVRRVVDFILDTFYDALALETLSLDGAAAAAGPGAVAEIQLDVQVTRKKSF